MFKQTPVHTNMHKQEQTHTSTRPHVQTCTGLYKHTHKHSLLRDCISLITEAYAFVSVLALQTHTNIFIYHMHHILYSSFLSSNMCKHIRLHTITNEQAMFGKRICLIPESIALVLTSALISALAFLFIVNLIICCSLFSFFFSCFLIFFASTYKHMNTLHVSHLVFFLCFFKHVQTCMYVHTCTRM